MRCCQLCGCTSWGPIGNPQELERVKDFVPYNRENEFVRCDGCKSVARVELLQEESPKLGAYLDPPKSPDPDAAWDLGGMFAKVMPSLPAPPTRTERLVGQILRSNPRGDIKGKSSDYVGWVVALARLIEWELDHPTGPAATEVTASTPWLVLSFLARAEFERWVTGLLDSRVGSGFEGNYEDAEYRRMVDYALKTQSWVNHATKP